MGLQEMKVNEMLLEIEGYLHPWKKVEFTKDDRKILKEIIERHLQEYTEKFITY